MPVVGFLSSGSANAFAGLVDAFKEGLHQAGFVEHRNVAIEFGLPTVIMVGCQYSLPISWHSELMSLPLLVHRPLA